MTTQPAYTRGVGPSPIPEQNCCTYNTNNKIQIHTGCWPLSYSRIQIQIQIKIQRQIQIKIQIQIQKHDHRLPWLLVWGQESPFFLSIHSLHGIDLHTLIMHPVFKGSILMMMVMLVMLLDDGDGDGEVWQVSVP